MKVIHIFDMDDTLLVTPTFASMMDGRGDPRLDEFVLHVKQAFLLFMSKEVDLVTKGDFIVMVDAHKRTNIPSYYLQVVREKIESTEASVKPEAFKKQYGIKRSSLKEMMNVLGEKDGHIVVLQVRGFHANPDTIGHIPNKEVEKTYMNAANKMIVTGRNDDLMFYIARRLQWLGLEYPNYGLHCFPNGKYKSIEDFKIAAILGTIEANGWDEVHFYEDRVDWLDAGEVAAKKKYPYIAFIKHHISNVHDARAL